MGRMSELYLETQYDDDMYNFEVVEAPKQLELPSPEEIDGEEGEEDGT